MPLKHHASVVQSIHSGMEVYTSQATNDMSTLLATKLDIEGPWQIHFFETDALLVLEMLTAIEREILCRSEAFIEDAYRRTCRHDNPGVTPPPLVLSSAERHRTIRAFYRLKLFGVLFYNYADRFKVDLQTTYNSFFSRLSAFEVDELVTTYQFLVREGLHFTSAFPHGNCSYVPIKPYRGCLDPFNCETCRGRCLGPNNPSSPWWRSVQPFWQAVEGDYLERTGLWANPAYCRQTPIKLWEDVIPTNEPNAGWLWWSNYRELYPVNKDIFVQGFRIFGFCFWDRERLADWHMLEDNWVSGAVG